MGRGFQIAVSNEHHEHVTFALQTAESFYQISAPASAANYHHYAFVWTKETCAVRIYVDLELVNQHTGCNIKAASPDLLINSNFITIGSYYDFVVTDLNYYRLSNLRIWRHPLAPSEIKELTQSKKALTYYLVQEIYLFALILTEMVFINPFKRNNIVFS